MAKRQISDRLTTIWAMDFLFMILQNVDVRKGFITHCALKLFLITMFLPLVFGQLAFFYKSLLAFVAVKRSVAAILQVSFEITFPIEYYTTLVAFEIFRQVVCGLVNVFDVLVQFLNTFKFI